MHRNRCGMYHGTCPVSLHMQLFRCGDLFRLLGWDSVYATVPLRQRQILAGAVREIGDGLCGALLLSLRHLSTSFRGIPLRRG